ncbi:hypothetical protein [Streptomyces capitiformicae]|uniref:hypothetical protein n=1 Tax=Streptomyces capitiformicae TaxID=2014920 RepID=UPI0016768902|nr:hypothetical protein [Streptomyces capitiformicae]
MCRVRDALDPTAREALLADPDAAVRRAADRQACRTDELRTDQVLAFVEDFERRDVIAVARLPRATAERLMDLDDSYATEALAGNPSLPPELVARLAVDPEHGVRRAVPARPDLTEEQRAAVDYTVERSDGPRSLGWVLALGGDSDALRACNGLRPPSAAPERGRPPGAPGRPRRTARGARGLRGPAVTGPDRRVAARPVTGHGHGGGGHNPVSRWPTCTGSWTTWAYPPDR